MTLSEKLTREHVECIYQQNPNLSFSLKSFTSGSSFCAAVLAGSDLHRVRTSGLAESPSVSSSSSSWSLLFNSRTFSDSFNLSLNESSSSLKNRNFSSIFWSLFIPSTQSLSLGFWVSEGTLFSCSVSSPSPSSSFLNGEPQNLLARDEER